MNLKHQVAWITGASQGIGRKVAEALAARGVHLVLTSRSEDRLNTLAGSLQKQYPDINILVAPADVTDAGRMQAVAKQALKELKRIDILINNAGVAGKIALMHEIPVDEINRTIDTNLKGAIYAMQAALPTMIEHRHGWIININSVAGKTAYPYWSIYDASKFGLRAITEAVAEEQRQNNIKVIGIYPGAVDTPIWEGIELEHEPDVNGMLDPDDVANAVLYALEQPKKTFVSEITLAPLQPAL